MDYQTYMRSSSWSQKRKQRLAIDNHRCRFCGHPGTTDNWLEVHHVPSAYKLIPDESVQDDLTTVCVRCHRLLTTAIRQDRAATKKPTRFFQLDRRMWGFAALLTVMILFLIYVTR